MLWQLIIIIQYYSSLREIALGIPPTPLLPIPLLTVSEPFLSSQAFKKNDNSLASQLLFLSKNNIANKIKKSEKSGKNVSV
jgi:hypothetical protein